MGRARLHYSVAVQLPMAVHPDPVSARFVRYPAPYSQCTALYSQLPALKLYSLAHHGRARRRAARGRLDWAGVQEEQGAAAAAGSGSLSLLTRAPVRATTSLSPEYYYHASSSAVRNLRPGPACSSGRASLQWARALPRGPCFNLK